MNEVDHSRKSTDDEANNDSGYLDDMQHTPHNHSVRDPLHNYAQHTPSSMGS